MHNGAEFLIFLGDLGFHDSMSNPLGVAKLIPSTGINLAFLNIRWGRCIAYKPWGRGGTRASRVSRGVHGACHPLGAPKIFQSTPGINLKSIFEVIRKPNDCRIDFLPFWPSTWSHLGLDNRTEDTLDASQDAIGSQNPPRPPKWLQNDV